MAEVAVFKDEIKIMICISGETAIREIIARGILAMCGPAGP